MTRQKTDNVKSDETDVQLKMKKLDDKPEPKQVPCEKKREMQKRKQMRKKSVIARKRKKLKILES